MSCNVCLEDTDGLVQPCNHPLCATCAAEWLSRNPTCPICRSVVVGIVPCGEGEKVRLIAFAPNCHVGITLKNKENGVCVVRTHPHDLARKCGVRVGDVITHINGIPTRHHVNAISIVNHATYLQYPLLCRVRPRRPILQRLGVRP